MREDNSMYFMHSVIHKKCATVALSNVDQF